MIQSGRWSCWCQAALDTQRALCQVSQQRWSDRTERTLILFTEKPLPPGWDEGYDPVTGHRYYIHHDSKTTTWTDPRTTSQDEQSDEDRSNDRPQSLWHDLPVECACRIVGSVPGATVRQYCYTAGLTPLLASPVQYLYRCGLGRDRAHEAEHHLDRERSWLH